MASQVWIQSPYVLLPLGIVTTLLLKKYFSGGVCRSKNRLDGKTVLITGANTGIGKETALDLAKRGARVYIACRDMTKGQAAMQDVIERSGNSNVSLMKLDLSSLTSVREFASEFLKKADRLDILINNAGVMWCPYWKTGDGFEWQFGVNHLGHFLLTNLLLDLIKQSPPSRIITVSSLGHTFVNKINFDDIHSEKSYGRVHAYSQSKLANVLFTRELARRLEGTGVTAYSLHPGAVRTELGRHISFFAFVNILLAPVFFIFTKTPKQGAQTSIYLAVTDGIEKWNGQYFSDCAVTKTSKAGEDDGMAKKLWEISTEMVDL